MKQWRTVGTELGRTLFFIIVDDGSCDGTPELLKKSGSDVEVICQNPCRGPGAAFEIGFRNVIPKLNDNDILITLEADNTSDPMISKQMIDKIEEGYDLVLAACYAEGGRIEGTTLYRVILSTLANKLMCILFRLPNVTTFSSFYRAFRPSILRKIAGKSGIEFYTKGFVCMAELLLLAAIHDARIVEVPMILQGFQRKGSSKMKPIRTMYEYFKFIILSAPLWLKRNR